MAIKGKSKGKTAKAVTRGPKPAYVPVKKPLLARRGFWIAVLSVLGVLLAAGLWYGFAKQARTDREEALTEARATAVGAYRTALEPIITTVGQPAAPAGFSAFPQLTTALDQLASGADPQDVAQAGSDGAEAARTAWQALGDIDAVALVRDKGLDELFVLRILDSKQTLVRALKLYEQVGELMAMAAEAPEGPERDALVARAQATLAIAQGLFDAGYRDYVEAQAQAGVFAPASVPTLPLPTGPTG